MKLKILNSIILLLLLTILFGMQVSVLASESTPVNNTPQSAKVSALKQAIAERPVDKNAASEVKQDLKEKEHAALRREALSKDPMEELGAFQDESIWVSLFKTIMMLLVVLGLIYLVLQKGLGKIIHKQHQGRRMKVVERLNLEAKRSLLLVQIDGRDILFAASEGGVMLMDLNTLLNKRAEETDFKDILSKNAKQGSVSDDSPED